MLILVSPYSQSNLNDKQDKLAMSEKLPTKKILFLASNPVNTVRLQIGDESKKIDEVLRQATKQQFDTKLVVDVTYQDWNDAIFFNKPNIVHFSGHGTGTELQPAENHNSQETRTLLFEKEGLVVEDESGRARLLEASTLKRLFEFFAKGEFTIECVLLNACFSHEQAVAISEYIPYVVGMKKAIGDKAAIEFASAFYKALGRGESYERAFDFACIWINETGIEENDIPKLFIKSSPSLKIDQPTLPEFYDRREGIFKQLKEYVLADELGDLRQKVIILHGGAGIGKSCLASDFINRDPETRDYFTDGIFWRKIGQDVSLIKPMQSLFSEIIQKEKDKEVKRKYSDISNVSDINILYSNLKDILQDKRCLIVLDDVWNKDDVIPPNFLGERCRLLVTTRDKAVTQELGARGVELGLLPQKKASKILTKCSGRDKPEPEFPEILD